MAIIRDDGDHSYREHVRQARHATEAEIGADVVQQLQEEGWDCYPEVTFGKLLPRCARGHLNASLGERVCDVVATKGTLLMMVECKKTFSLDLIEQALEWTLVAPLVAVAVPTSAINNRNTLKDHLRAHFGLGVVGCSKNYFHWHRRPRLLRYNLRNVPTLAGVLTPAMKASAPGAKHTWRRSPYQDTMQAVRCVLAQHGPMVLREVFARLEGAHGHHYSSAASMRSSVSSSIRDGTEPDLTIGADGQLRWDQSQCPHGTKYVEHVNDWADRRKESESRRSAPPQFILKSCPMCGTTPHGPVEMSGGWCIECSLCHVRTPSSHEPAEVVRIWNKRTK